MSHLVKDSSGAYVQWKHFLGMGSTEGVRESIKASWLRCREFGLDPANRKSVGTIPKVRDGQSNGQETLRQLLVTRFQDMESHFKFDRFVVLFASPSGRTLSLYGNERIIETFENLGVCESVNLSERFSGTNAPAVCLVEQKPTTVLGAEHYFKDFHWAECAAAPVLDYQRRFLGCLGVTTTSESRIVLESLVEYFCWLATTMTMEFFVEEKLQKLEIQDTFFRSTFERADQCLLLVDRGGEILDVNLYGQKLLGVFERGATRRNFRELLRSPHIDRPLSSLHKTHHLVKPLPPARTNEPLLMEAVPLFRQNGDERAYLLRISPKNKRQWSAPTPGASVRNLITFDHIVAEDTKSLALIETVKKAARGSSTILIEGETGTGKELLARAIHSASPYRNGPFVAINCSAVPRDLVESELYGYERGAYTGARHNGSIGKFEVANHGTILLDEIQAMPATAQMKLLRVIEEREVTRLGGHTPIPLDFRVIAASSADLRREVEEGDFLDSLYFRLKVVSFRIPPLRARKNDIRPLVAFFMEQMNERFGRTIKGIDDELMALFLRYAWPGNVRELRNRVEYVFNFCEGEIITAKDLGEQIADFLGSEGCGERTLAGITRNLLDEALKTHRNVSEAASSLGVSASTFYRKMRKYGLSK